MRHILHVLWQEDDGVLSFEWTLLAVLLVIGIVSGLSAARDAIIDELGDHAEAVLSFDQSYSFAGGGGYPPSMYTDQLGTLTDCNRSTLLPINTLNDGRDGG